jgi:hypothetical protein
MEITRKALIAERTQSAWREPLRNAVRRALRVGTGVIATGLALSAGPTASAEPFPAVFPLRSLLSDGGGDGSQGFVLEGIDESDRSGEAVSAAGDGQRRRHR